MVIHFYFFIKSLECILDYIVLLFRRFTGSVETGKALVSFALQDELSSFAISRPVSEEDPIVLVAVTVTGILHIFEHHLNG